MRYGSEVDLNSQKAEVGGNEGRDRAKKYVIFQGFFPSLSLRIFAFSDRIANKNTLPVRFFLVAQLRERALVVQSSLCARRSRRLEDRRVRRLEASPASSKYAEKTRRERKKQADTT